MRVSQLAKGLDSFLSNSVRLVPKRPDERIDSARVPQLAERRGSSLPNTVRLVPKRLDEILGGAFILQLFKNIYYAFSNMNVSYFRA